MMNKRVKNEEDEFKTNEEECKQVNDRGPPGSKGNYHSYYKKRIDLPDRMKDLDESWFQGKVCLDIGCNDGLVTCEIAKSFKPESIIGIDIDKFLIESAESRLKRARFSILKEGKELPSSSSLGRFVPRSVKGLKPNMKSLIDSNKVLSEKKETFPANVRFIHKDFFELEESFGGRYDTIICLSITKWIHLYHGDEGILRFFGNIHGLLKNNGLFILEYQPWKSYKKRKNASEICQNNYNRIEIFPSMFRDMLINRFHFDVQRELRTDETSCSGFLRPILVLRKLNSIPPT
jgi:7SK snRNA methylphosphate capping enzyme